MLSWSILCFWYDDLCQFLVVHKRFNRNNGLETCFQIQNQSLGPYAFTDLYLHFVSWEPEGHYQYSKMFCWELEGHYGCTKSMVIAPFWFSTGTSLKSDSALLALNKLSLSVTVALILRTRWQGKVTSARVFKKILVSWYLAQSAGCFGLSTWGCVFLHVRRLKKCRNTVYTELSNKHW